MSFDIIEVRHKTGRNRAPASISLRIRKGGDLPACHIGLTRNLSALIALKRGDRMQVLVGTGEHKGLLRLRRDPEKGTAGTRPLGTGAFILNVGHIPHFGLVEVHRHPCEARALDAETLEISLPDWSKLVPAQKPAAPESQQRADPPHNGGIAARPPLKILGAVIDSAPDNESIAFRGKTMELTTVQAAFAVTLVRAKGATIGRDFLRKNLVPGKLLTDSMVDAVAEPGLKQALQAVGLTLRSVKGVGFSVGGLTS